jgi:uncharacterized iron-regulated protein
VKKNLFNLHWNIYQYLKKKSLSYEGKPSPLLKSYRVDQLYYNQRTVTPSTQEQLLNSCLNSQVIYLGDFHTFDQNQRSLHRIMRTLLRNKKKFKLALEMVHAEHQHILEAYIDGHISELEFLESINYSESWRFPWNHYKMIFDLVKDESINVVALNCVGNLAERDQFAAMTIAQELELDPTQPVLVLYGELHILPNKLPKQVLLKTKKELRQTIIHQNIDEVYWQLRKSSNEAKVVSFSRDEFCLVTSAPWVKYESMIYWYENLIDDPDFDMHEYMTENGVLTFGANAYDNFIQISKTITANLKLKINPEELENFTLYDHTQLEEIEEYIEDISPKMVQSFYTSLLESNRHLKIPNQFVYYCPSYSLNKMASLAGFHVYNVLLKERGLTDLEIYQKKSKHEIFIFMTLQNMFGYFFAKIINPHRKCNLYLDLEQQMQETKLKSQQVFLQNILAILDDEIDLTIFFQSMNLNKMYRYARQTGYLFGEYFYHGMANQNLKISTKQLLQDYFMAEINLENYQRIKTSLFPNKLYKMQRKRFF